jgi:hypothetical protein
VVAVGADKLRLKIGTLPTAQEEKVERAIEKKEHEGKG